MSIFNELLPKLSEISNTITKNFNDDLKAAFECFDKLEEEYQNGRARAREKAPKDKNPMTTLQSINEDDDEPNKLSDAEPKRKSSKSTNNTDNRSSVESNSEKPRRGSKKRSKNEVDGLSSPEQDKRLKRNASIKAQSIISKQVNVNLTQKMRREESSEKIKRNNKKKDDDKENTEPAQIIQ
ncbi:DEAD-box ATP-dependent RNA helicase 27-like, partial [Ostrinia furnacalis]|uniref:DEAD-box ATP-dependent RNA helicase 27-like n=1 Tax=Ostrinia furnacalis TaxID=93504 RepID=UPI00103E867D